MRTWLGEYLGLDCTGDGKNLDCVFLVMDFVYCCATSPGGRGRDSRIYLDHRDMRGEEEASFKPFAFSRSRSCALARWSSGEVMGRR